MVLQDTISVLGFVLGLEGLVLSIGFIVFTDFCHNVVLLLKRFSALVCLITLITYLTSCALTATCRI